VIWISKNDSPETNSNYYNDFELDEFEKANDNESEDGTWDEDGLDFDLNINFDLRVSENVGQPIPVVTAIQPIPNQTTRKFTFRWPVMSFIGNSSLVFELRNTSFTIFSIPTTNFKFT
jgi:hypothetical protein